nr:MAG TPA: IGP family C-type lectin domain [Caudoviricetes sp.]
MPFKAPVTGVLRAFLNCFYRWPGGQQNGRRSTGTGRIKRTAADRLPTHHPKGANKNDV